MPRVMVFNQVSLDGYFADAHGDMRWAHQGNQDAEWKAFVAGNAKSRTFGNGNVWLCYEPRT